MLYSSFTYLFSIFMYVSISLTKVSYTYSIHSSDHIEVLKWSVVSSECLDVIRGKGWELQLAVKNI